MILCFVPFSSLRTLTGCKARPGAIPNVNDMYGERQKKKKLDLKKKIIMWEKSIGANVVKVVKA